MQTTLKQTEISASLSSVSADEVSLVWGTAFPLLKKALDRGAGRLNEAVVYKGLLTGELCLWLATKNGLIGAMVTQVYVYPTGLRVFRMLLAGGERAEDWFPLLPQLQAHGKSLGCTKMELFGRPGWEKLMPEGWRKFAVEMEVDI